MTTKKRLRITTLDPGDPNHLEVVKSTLQNFLHSQGLPDKYPNFDDWYVNSVIPGFENGTRLIHIVNDKEGNIVGTTIIKVTHEETKLCTIVVSEELRGQGLGTELLALSLSATKKIVDSKGFPSKIIVTVPEDTSVNPEQDHQRTLNFLSKFGFKVTAIENDKYKKGTQEFIATSLL